MSRFTQQQRNEIDDFIGIDVDTSHSEHDESFEAVSSPAVSKTDNCELVVKKDSFVLDKKTKFWDDYTIEHELGKGSYGDVFKCIHNASGDIRAVKQIKRSKIVNHTRFINEVTALKMMDHPNIIKMFEVYEEEEAVYLVQELCTGGELYDRIIKDEYLTEKTTARIFQQILHSIVYSHKNKISHRDLKPENFMFESEKEDSNIKLIDFGLSKSFFKIDETSGDVGLVRMKTKAGTSLFMAPEVFSSDYSQACDMWSAGIILFIMLWGYPPFYGETNEEIQKEILEGELEFDDEVWDEISANAKDLIMKLLSSEDKRISAKEALLHPWIKEKESNILIPSIHLNRLKEFQKSKKLKKAALTYLATRTSDSDVNEEMKLFVKLDKNKDGYLTLKELREGMKDIENADEVAEILQGVDIDNNGAINYTEFIAATLDQKSYFSQTKKMDDVFKVFDRDGDGVIDEDEIRQLLSWTSSEGNI